MIILTILRIILALLLLFVGLLVVALASVLPWRIHGVRASSWCATIVSRIMLWLLRIRVHGVKEIPFAAHRGFVFANHTTYLDTVVLMAAFPLRWVAAAEVRQWPFIGRMGTYIDTIFVDRSSSASRHAVRDTLAQAKHFPPICLYPEGRVNASGTLAPLRYGAFAAAIGGQAAILPVVLHYADPAFMQQLAKTDGLFDGGWLTAKRFRRLDVTLTALPVVVTETGDSAETLSEATYAAMSAVLQRPPIPHGG
jgi:1-acyl-sn-glycerol-3-phosphate acyltransferase